MFKKTVLLLAVLSVIFSISPVWAVDKYAGYEIPVDISVNGHFIKCPVKPVLIDNSTYIPLRAFSDAIGGSISWDGELNVATFTKDNNTFMFYEKKDYSLINGSKTDYSAAMYKDLMFVPVRAVSETLGYDVEWDGQYLVVNITAHGTKISQDVADNTYSYEDIVLLSKITHIESGSQSFNTRGGIAQTVVNRVKSPLFPDTVRGVIYDTKYGTQFPPAHTDLMNQTPSKASVIAAKCALNGVDFVGNSLYFISTRNVESSWVHNNRQHSITIGGIAFYL